MNLHHTRGIVLRTVKYGETSVIVSIYTELFGIQSYLVNGVRVSSKKGSGRANLFQPGAVLDMIVYHNEGKNLQRIREFRWGYLYRHVFADVVKNAVALFMVELVYKCIKQPEQNPDLFPFLEAAFIALDQSPPPVVANFPLYFSLHLAGFLGFAISDDYDELHTYLDLREGEFCSDRPDHPYFVEGDYSAVTSRLLKSGLQEESGALKLYHETRRVLLHAYQDFYALHISDFGTMRTLPVLQEVLS